MSTLLYDPNCAGCQPALFEPSTGKRLPDDHPIMVEVRKIFAACSLETKQAWHRFTCQNSRAPADLALVKTLTDKIGQIGAH